MAIRASWIAAIVAAACASTAASVAAQEEVSEEEARQDEARTQRTAESMAQMPDEEARSRFRIGRTLYEEGRFREAAGEFSEAYRLSERPALLFNVYLAYRDAGLRKKAADALRRFLDESEDVHNRESLQARLAALQETISQQEAEEQERTEQAAEQAAEQAEQRERARAKEQIEQTRRDVKKRERQRSVIPWVVGGVGVVMLAAGTVTGVLTLQDADQLDKDCPNDVCGPQIQLDKAKRLARTTDALLFGGLAALGTGVLLYFVLDGEPETDAEQAPQASVGCTTEGCEAAVRVQF